MKMRQMSQSGFNIGGGEEGVASKQWVVGVGASGAMRLSRKVDYYLKIIRFAVLGTAIRCRGRTSALTVLRVGEVILGGASGVKCCRTGPPRW